MAGWLARYQGRRLDLLEWGGDGAAAPPPSKDADAPNLNFFQVHMYIYYNVEKKLTLPKKMETYELRKIFIDYQYKYSAKTSNTFNQGRDFGLIGGQFPT